MRHLYTYILRRPHTVQHSGLNERGTCGVLTRPASQVVTGGGDRRVLMWNPAHPASGPAERSGSSPADIFEPWQLSVAGIARPGECATCKRPLLGSRMVRGRHGGSLERLMGRPAPLERHTD